MLLVDTAKDKQDYAYEEDIKKPGLESLYDVNERVRKSSVKEESLPLQGVTKSQGFLRIPKIKELELLKEGIYSVDLEKTINDMFMVIKSMEAQVESVLKINTVLEKDLKEAKDVIVELKAEKTRLEAVIARLENEMPSKRDQQIEIDHLLEERNNAQTMIRMLNTKIEKMKKNCDQNQQRSINLQEEKRDFISEINFLESRLYSASEKISQNEDEIHTLMGEKVANDAKINSLEQKIKDVLDEKFGLMKELRLSKEALKELHHMMTDTKLQAKRSFYKNLEEKKSDPTSDDKPLEEKKPDPILEEKKQDLENGLSE